MKVYQRIITFIGFSAILATILFPRWIYEYREGSGASRAGAGYHFIFTPPSVNNIEQMKTIFPRAKQATYKPSFSVQMCAVELFTQVFTIFLLTISLIAIPRRDIPLILKFQTAFFTSATCAVFLFLRDSGF